MPGDGRQHGNREVLDRAAADLGLEQVAEHVDAGPELGNPVEVPGMERGWGRADADHRRLESGGTQPLGGPDRARTLGLGDPGDRGQVARRVGMAGVGHDAVEPAIGRPVEDPADLDQFGRVGQHARAPLAAVDLDQDREPDGMSGGKARDLPGRLG